MGCAHSAVGDSGRFTTFYSSGLHYLCQTSLPTHPQVSYVFIIHLLISLDTPSVKFELSIYSNNRLSSPSFQHQCSKSVYRGWLRFSLRVTLACSIESLTYSIYTCIFHNTHLKPDTHEELFQFRDLNSHHPISPPTGSPFSGLSKRI